MTTDLITKIQGVDLENLANRAYSNAKEHGFFKSSNRFQHYLFLVIAELGEALEADRRNKRALPEAFDRAMKEPVSPHEAATPEEIYDHWFEAYIKDTLEDELADAAIIVLSLSGSWLYDENLNAERRYVSSSYLKPNSEYPDLALSLFYLCRAIINTDYHRNITILYWLNRIAASLEIDLFKHIELKMTYNEHRPYLHGKKY